MCEYLSFKAVRVEGDPVAVYPGTSLSSHWGIDDLWKLRPGEANEREWTGEAEDSLAVREGCPEKIGGSLYLSGATGPKSLEGCPEKLKHKVIR